MKFHQDDKFVYYEGEPLSKISSEGFSILYEEEEIVYGELIACGFIRDKNAIYWFKKPLNKDNVIVKKISNDTKEFTIIRDHQPCFAKDSKQVFFFKLSGSVISIPHSDPISFRSFDSVFSKDDNQVYAHASFAREGLMVLTNNEVDVCSFQSIGTHQATDRDNIYNYNHTVHASNESKYTKLLDPMLDEYIDICDDKQYTAAYLKNQEYLFEQYPEIIGWWHPSYEFKKHPFTTMQGGGEKYLIDGAVYYAREHSFALKLYALTLIRTANPLAFIELNYCYGKDNNEVIRTGFIGDSFI